MNPDPEKGIECYVNADFTFGWNQGNGKDPGSVLSIMACVITYANCPIIWVNQPQIEIALITTEL